MFNKILVFGGIALAAILIVENMVTWFMAYVFIDSGSKAWILSSVSVLMWIFIWYWARWMLQKDVEEWDGYDF